MTTISYGFGGTNVILANGVTDGAQWAPAFASNPAGTRHVAVWSSNAVDAGVAGRLFSGITPRSDEFAVSPPAPSWQSDASISALADGRFIVTYTDTQDDPGGDIRARLLDTNGMPAGSFDILVDPTDLDQSDVAALAGGGYVVGWTRHNAGGNGDIYRNVYNADGSAIVFNGAVSTGPANASRASVVGLVGGGHVFVWQESPAGGGDSEVRFRRFDATGAALDASSVVIDTSGSVNRDIQVGALPDGGFVVAYEDNGWGNGTDITAHVYNADGSSRTGSRHVNGPANGGSQAGDQINPTLAVLPNGVFVVGWNDDNAFLMQGYNSSGAALGENVLQLYNTIENEIVHVGGGRIADIWQSSASDGSGDSIRLTYHTLFRKIEGDANSENIVGIDDGTLEILSGLEGNDTLEGREGPDSLRGGDGFDSASYFTAPVGVTASLHDRSENTGHAEGDSYHSIEGLFGSGFDDVLTGDSGPNRLFGSTGNDTITGRLGDDIIVGNLGEDTAAFLQNVGQYGVEDFGGLVRVSGADGVDVLYIEHLRFTDATLTPVDDGNPLFDALYYYSRNTDVYFAGVDALAHFDAFGRHEGRDPNAFFDTSGYLAVNQDVAATGANPLEHYHQGGWQQGRDPSAAFDTTLYLLRNPDVAAAGVDPLAHFLQFGFAEGRQAHQAIGASIVGGFDAQHYLFHNPDVAAAGVDPLAHYNASGRYEGRDPNAWFDTAGYLAHYADVAAASANPLDHYMQFGWQEGRDPSAGFDTLGYLAANPDVAAGGANPLAHYMQFGIYEGRQVVNDAMWG